MPTKFFRFCCLITFLWLIPFLPSSYAEINTISLSEAVLQTLHKNPEVKVQEEKVKQSKGQVQTASGQFDWMAVGLLSREQERQHLTQDQLEAMDPSITQHLISDSTQKDTTIYSLGLQKQVRDGIIVSPRLSTFDLEDFSANIDSYNRSNFSVEIIIPLMRGLGSENTGAVEMAAQVSLNATELSSKHNISQLIYSTTRNYWNCLATLRSFELFVDTQKRSDKLLNMVEKLVKVGTLEPAILNQARAKLYSSQGDLSEGETVLYQSKQALALSMGYSPEELANAPSPTGEFPIVVDIERIRSEAAQLDINAALKRRGDYLTAKLGVETEKILLQKSRNDIKPGLNFTFRVGYTGLNEDPGLSRYVRSVYDNTAGPNVFGGITLELPIENNAAKGDFIRRKSLAIEAELKMSQLSNFIASEVLVALERLRNSVRNYYLAVQSEDAYKKAVEFENQKYKAGTSTLTDVIDIEDRYLNARISRIEAIRKYSVALAEYRYVTGTLLDVQDRTLRFKTKNLLELPDIKSK